MASSTKTETVIPKFTELNNLASVENGSKILFATDDWFAAAENLLEVRKVYNTKYNIHQNVLLSISLISSKRFQNQNGKKASLMTVENGWTVVRRGEREFLDMIGVSLS